MNMNTLEILDNQGNILLRIAESLENNVFHFKVIGRLSEQTAHEFGDELSAAFFACKAICIDMSETESISGLALQNLLKAQQTADAKDISMTLLNLSDAVMQTFVANSFTECFNIEER